MKSIIEELYFGNVRPFEQLQPHLYPYRKTREKTLAGSLAFAEKLSPALKKEFADVMDAGAAAAAMELFESFAQGLALGARLCFELCAWPGREREPPVDREGISV